MQENSDVETQIELTEKVNEELVAFVEFQPLYENKYCLVTDLTGCKLYTLHTKEETDAVFQGFSFWQLVYTIENSYEIRVLLDAEFEKIYAVGIYDMGEAYYYEMISWLDAITGNYGLENLVYVWAEEILYYYDLREIAYVEYDVITESNAAVYEDLDVYLVNNYEETEEALIDDRICSLVFYEDETSRLDGGADLKINEETGNVYYEMGFSLMTEYLQL